MEQRVACRKCGALNKSDSTFCGLCYERISASQVSLGPSRGTLEMRAGPSTMPGPPSGGGLEIQSGAKVLAFPSRPAAPDAASKPAAPPPEDSGPPPTGHDPIEFENEDVYSLYPTATSYSSVFGAGEVTHEASQGDDRGVLVGIPTSGRMTGATPEALQYQDYANSLATDPVSYLAVETEDQGPVMTSHYEHDIYVEEDAWQMPIHDHETVETDTAPPIALREVFEPPVAEFPHMETSVAATPEVETPVAATPNIETKMPLPPDRIAPPIRIETQPFTQNDVNLPTSSLTDSFVPPAGPAEEISTAYEETPVTPQEIPPFSTVTPFTLSWPVPAATAPPIETLETPAAAIPVTPIETSPAPSWIHQFDGPRSASPRTSATPITTPESSFTEPSIWPRWFLTVFWFVAWMIPGVITLAVADRLSFGKLLDATVVFQLLGYGAAVALLAFAVKRMQGGDWGSLGIRFHDASLDDIFWGGALGLLLIGIWTPIGIALNGGRLGLDAMVRAFVGETTGIGLLLAGIMIVVGAPVIEEVFFRGMLYARFSRRGPKLAIIGTSVLFVLAHVNILLIPLWILALVLGWKRQTRSLWYTIGAHAAWNFVVICIGAWMVLGPPATFVSADAGYSVRYPRTWERLHSIEQSFPGGAIDVAIQNTSGSFVGVGHFDIPLVTAEQALPAILDGIQRPLQKGSKVTPGAATKSDEVYEGFPAVYEASGSIVDADGTTFRSHYVAILHHQSTRAFVFIEVCPEKDCARADSSFELLTESFRPSR